MEWYVCIALFLLKGVKKLVNKFFKYEYAKSMLETELTILIKEFERKHGYTPVEHMKSRLKSKESIEKKLLRRDLDITEENVLRYIDDIVGVRIVVSFINDVYDIVSLIASSTNILIKERRDYIQLPKQTGYTSYHFKVLVPVYLENYVEYVPAEIQVRTVAMDFWASLDHKISYKFHEEIPEEVKLQMQNYAKDIQELDRKMYELNKTMNKY